MRRAERIAVVAALLLAACPHRTPADAPLASPDSQRQVQTDAVGIYHTLQKGETLWSISRRYGVDVDELVEVNGISDPRDMRAGRLIFIPDVDALAPEPAAGNGGLDHATAKPPATASHRASGTTFLAWPLSQGVLYSGFGVRRDVPHDGIDLGAPEGTEVLAAAAGEVIYVGQDRAFGHLVILRHADGWVTVYAHNRDVIARLGQHVTQGQAIAHVGQSGRSQGPHLHFELRKGQKPVDPVRYLPED